MVELFTNVPEEVKQKDEIIVDYVLKNFMPYQYSNFISNFIKTCSDPEEQEFVNFYYSLRLEQMKGE